LPVIVAPARFQIPDGVAGTLDLEARVGEDPVVGLRHDEYGQRTVHLEARLLGRLVALQSAEIGDLQLREGCVVRWVQEFLCPVVHAESTPGDAPGFPRSALAPSLERCTLDVAQAQRGHMLPDW
jgi:hypothetical protein